MAGGFEVVVEFALQNFPDGVTVRADHHAAFDDLSRLRHVAMKVDVLIPRGEVLAARSDGRICHLIPIFRVSSVRAVARSRFAAAIATSACARTSRVRATISSVWRCRTRNTVEVPACNWRCSLAYCSS